jgi:hypothetical protein
MACGGSVGIVLGNGSEGSVASPSGLTLIGIVVVVVVVVIVAGGAPTRLAFAWDGCGRTAGSGFWLLLRVFEIFSACFFPSRPIQDFLPEVWIRTVRFL